MIVAIIVIVVAAIVLPVLACCKLSGDCSKTEEDREKKGDL